MSNLMEICEQCIKVMAKTFGLLFQLTWCISVIVLFGIILVLHLFFVFVVVVAIKSVYMSVNKGTIPAVMSIHQLIIEEYLQCHLFFMIN